MRAPRQQPQHPRSIVWVAGLAENGVIDHDDCVRAENIVPRPALRNCQRFFPRQSLGAIARGLSRERRFVDIGRLHAERNARVAE
jgi:hypothetical protein